MKLVRIEHLRCDSWDTSVYFVAPDTITREQFRSDVSSAQKAYLDARAAFEKLTPQPELGLSNLESFPENITVVEAKRQRDEAIRLSKEWVAARSRVSGSFSAHLQALGYRSFHELGDDELLTTGANWGHHHGERYDY